MILFNSNIRIVINEESDCSLFYYAGKYGSK